MNVTRRQILSNTARRLRRTATSVNDIVNEAKPVLEVAENQIGDRRLFIVHNIIGSIERVTTALKQPTEVHLACAGNLTLPEIYGLGVVTVKQFQRGEALGMFTAAALAFLTVRCGGDSSPTAPSSDTTALLNLVQAQPESRSAQRVQFNSVGASRIAIRGDLNWTFWHRGVQVGVGPVVSPTLDTANYSLPSSAQISVQSL